VGDAGRNVWMSFFLPGGSGLQGGGFPAAAGLFFFSARFSFFFDRFFFLRAFRKDLPLTNVHLFFPPFCVSYLSLPVSSFSVSLAFFTKMVKNETPRPLLFESLSPPPLRRGLLFSPILADGPGSACPSFFRRHSPPTIFGGPPPPDKN